MDELDYEALCNEMRDELRREFREIMFDDCQSDLEEIA